MKMFIVNIISASAVRKFLFINALNRFKGIQINPSCFPKLGRANVSIDYSDWDNLPHRLRGYTVLHTDDLSVAVSMYTTYLGDINNEATHYSIEEADADTHRWFMTWGASDFTARLLGDFKEHLNSWERREVIDRITASMSERTYKMCTGRNLNDPRATWKNRGYRYGSGFAIDRQFCLSMGKLIAESIKEDEDVFSASFMEDYSTESGLHHRIAQAAFGVLSNKGISLEIEQQHCDHWDYSANTTEVNIGRGRYRSYCQHCAEDSDIVVETNDTGILMLREQAYWHDSSEEYYEHEQYDEQYDEDSDSDDDRDSDTSSLMGYSTNVLDVLDKDASFTSSAFGEFHMGIEVELVTSGSVSGAVADLRTQLGEDYIICKSDGSLPSGGVEVVTAPRGLHDHIARFKAWVIDSNYRAWNTNKCGMHVHIDSRAFTRLTLGKFIMFINDEKNAEFVRKIAGRHPHIDEQARTYCAAEGQYAMENPSKALKGKSTNRYYMVNTTCLRSPEANRLGVRHVGERNFNTIELRVFRASLKKERLLAQIEFTHAVIMFCRVASMRDLNGASFLKWLKSTDNRYPHLSDWYGIRRRVGAKNAAPSESTCVDNLNVSS